MGAKMSIFRKIIKICVLLIALGNTSYATNASVLPEMFEGGWSVDCSQDQSKWRTFDSGRGYAFGPNGYSIDITKTVKDNNIYYIKYVDDTFDVFKTRDNSNDIEYLAHINSNNEIDQDWRYADGSGTILHKCAIKAQYLDSLPISIIGGWSTHCENSSNHWRVFSEDARAIGPGDYQDNIVSIKKIGNIIEIKYNKNGEIFEYNNGTLRVIGQIDDEFYFTKKYKSK